MLNVTQHVKWIRQSQQEIIHLIETSCVTRYMFEEILG